MKGVFGMSITEKQRDICESLNWSIHEYENGCTEIETYSPKGEDLVFTIYADEEFIAGVKRLYEDYDVDEHAELWIAGRGKNGVPASISELLHDAEDIEALLWELLETLQKVEK